jgi:hypothetical protein
MNLWNKKYAVARSLTHTQLNKFVAMKRHLNTLFCCDEISLSPEVLDQVISFDHKIYI